MLPTYALLSILFIPLSILFLPPPPPFLEKKTNILTDQNTFELKERKVLLSYDT